MTGGVVPTVRDQVSGCGLEMISLFALLYFLKTLLHFDVFGHSLQQVAQREHQSEKHSVKKQEKVEEEDSEDGEEEDDDYNEDTDWEAIYCTDWYQGYTDHYQGIINHKSGSDAER